MSRAETELRGAGDQRVSVHAGAFGTAAFDQLDADARRSPDTTLVIS
jgi:hypothetical protein